MESPRPVSFIPKATDSTADMTVSDDGSIGDATPFPTRGSKRPTITSKLMKIIAREMAATFIKAASENEDDDADSRGHPGESVQGESITSTSYDEDLVELADVLMAALDKGTGLASEEDIHKILHEHFSSDMSNGESLGRSNHSGSTRTQSSKNTSTVGSDSNLSDASTKRYNDESMVMDVWNPTFWSAAEVDRSRHSEVSQGSGKQSLGSEKRSQTSSDRRHVAAANMLLAVAKEMQTDFESEQPQKTYQHHHKDDNDDDSEISDLSGLTDAFDLLSSSKLEAKAQKKAPPSLPFQQEIVIAPVSSTSLKKKKERSGRLLSYSVRFSQVDVRMYDRILTDNPGCTNGPSIGIGWSFVPQDTCTVEEWERGRRRQKSSTELILSRAQRESLVRELGYSDKEIAAAVREVNKLKYQRKQTVNNLGVQKVEEAVEGAKRKMKKLLFLGRKEKLAY